MRFTSVHVRKYKLKSVAPRFIYVRQAPACLSLLASRHYSASHPHARVRITPRLTHALSCLSGASLCLVCLSVEPLCAFVYLSVPLCHAGSPF